MKTALAAYERPHPLNDTLVSIGHLPCVVTMVRYIAKPMSTSDDDDDAGSEADDEDTSSEADDDDASSEADDDDDDSDEADDDDCHYNWQICECCSCEIHESEIQGRYRRMVDAYCLQEAEPPEGTDLRSTTCCLQATGYPCNIVAQWPLAAMSGPVSSVVLGLSARAAEVEKALAVFKEGSGVTGKWTEMSRRFTNLKLPPTFQMLRAVGGTISPYPNSITVRNKFEPAEEEGGVAKKGEGLRLALVLSVMKKQSTKDFFSDLHKASVAKDDSPDDKNKKSFRHLCSWQGGSESELRLSGIASLLHSLVQDLYKKPVLKKFREFAFPNKLMQDRFEPQPAEMIGESHLSFHCLLDSSAAADTVVTVDCRRVDVGGVRSVACR